MDYRRPHQRFLIMQVCWFIGLSMVLGAITLCALWWQKEAKVIAAEILRENQETRDRPKAYLEAQEEIWH
ncbi:MAG TPA: hypothetical protein VJ742_12845 [Nitrososphaera sp.]|nr:hypothetical protein [Nitrososphaera sp.]